MGPYEPCHVLGMSWACSSHVIGDQPLIFDAFFLIFSDFLPIFFQFFSIFFQFFSIFFDSSKCLYLGGFWSDFEFLKTHMGSYESCHVPGMSWACSSHVIGTQRLIFDAFFSIFFKKILIFFIFFAKNVFFFWKIH